MSKTEAHQQLEIEPGKSRPLFSLRLFVRNCWLVKILIDREGLVVRKKAKCGNTTRSEAYCKGKTKMGRPCRAAATDGGLCFFHANPNKAAELGRVGGRRSRYPLGAVAEPPRDVKSMKGVLEAAARLIEDVYSGKISPRIAGSLAPLLALQMRAIRETDLETRIAKLELSQTESRESSHDSPDIRLNGGGKGSAPAEIGSD